VNVTLYCAWRPSDLTTGLHGRRSLVRYNSSGISNSSGSGGGNCSSSSSCCYCCDIIVFALALGAFSLDGFSALSSVRGSDSVGWVTGRASGL